MTRPVISNDCIFHHKKSIENRRISTSFNKWFALYLLMVRIVVIDNNSVYRMGLVTLIKADPRFEIVGEYRSFSIIEPTIGTLNAHMALVDISLNKECGIDIVRFIKNRNPALKVVALTALKDEFNIINAVETGVDGYIHKDAEPEVLIYGISKIMEGEKFYSLEISNLLVGNLYKRNFRGLPFLTTKEKQIIKFLMDGYSSKQIAAQLAVSPRTIDTHRANILGKFNLKNTSELIARIIEQKITL
jgi:DNA-binding NarL/FixJ family response regulator